MQDFQKPLKINEIFFSIQGESLFAGCPTVFIRTTGCNIRCNYCDTKYSYFEGSTKTIEEVVEKVRGFKATHVCVTGGEPLAQPNVFTLVKILCDLGYITSVETNGYYDATSLDSRAVKILDIKTPGSGEGASFNYSNLNCLQPSDQIKFVVTSLDDYEWSKNIILKHSLNKKCTVLMSPEFSKMQPKLLSEKILSDFLPVRLQLQLHKYIWDANTRGV